MQKPKRTLINCIFISYNINYYINSNFHKVLLWPEAIFNLRGGGFLESDCH